MNIKLSYHWVVTALLAIATGCSNDNITPETKPDSGKPETTQVSFIAGNEGTRTSLNYGNGDFYWEDGDRIFVEDDDHTFHASSNNVSGTQVPHFKFMMPGKYTANEYLVYYPGKNGTKNQVTISANQTQTEPDNTFHFGTSGDCGTGKATRQTNGQYTFKLTHSATYLCFKPTFNHPLASTYVTKIEVTADQPIAGSYTLDTNGNLTGTGNSKTITLNLTGTGSYANGFQMKNDATGKNCAAGRMFMVMMPGKYRLTVKYFVKDIETNASGVITKKFPAFEYGANDYYDIPSALNIKYYGDDYYTWDAKKDYWYGHKNDQPKKIGIQKSNYPTSADADRWYNKDATFPTAAKNTARSCPNANEITWYCMKGDPHWDTTTLWSVWEHLYTGGMWFMKESKIASKENKSIAHLTNFSYDGKNRIKDKIWETPPSNKKTKKGTPDDLSKYFFLPAMGKYASGKLTDFRTYGFYWAKTPEPSFDYRAYNLFFNENEAGLSNSSDRWNGYRLWTSE